MNNHIPWDLLVYNNKSAFTPKIKIAISASSTTAYNWMQQLRHGKSVRFLFDNVLEGESE